MRNKFGNKNKSGPDKWSEDIWSETTNGQKNDIWSELRQMVREMTNGQNWPVFLIKIGFLYSFVFCSLFKTFSIVHNSPKLILQ